jgi:hypothetical protein
MMTRTTTLHLDNDKIRKITQIYMVYLDIYDIGCSRSILAKVEEMIHI